MDTNAEGTGEECLRSLRSVRGNRDEIAYDRASLARWRLRTVGSASQEHHYRRGQTFDLEPSTFDPAPRSSAYRVALTPLLLALTAHCPPSTAYRPPPPSAQIVEKFASPTVVGLDKLFSSGSSDPPPRVGRSRL